MTSFFKSKRSSIAFMLAIPAIILASEAALRFGLGLGNPLLIAPDLKCEYVVKPDQRTYRFFCHTYTNHYGMRSAEISSSKDPHVLRIMFVGDSITYGTTQVDQNNIFTELIHRELPSVIHRPVEVLNASASAWAPSNEISYVSSRGVFQSDLVLLVLNSGDLSQPRATIAQVGDDLPQSRPATAIGELYTRFIKPRILHTQSRKDAGTSALLNAEETISKNFAGLDALQIFVTRHGSTLGIIYLPFPADIPERSTPSLSNLQSWSATHGVPLIDLTAEESSFPVAAITLSDRTHFNAKGHSIIGRAIEDHWNQIHQD